MWSLFKEFYRIFTSQNPHWKCSWNFSWRGDNLQLWLLSKEFYNSWKHLESVHKCILCDKVYKNKYLVIAHIKEYHEAHCMNCGKFLKSSKLLKSHVENCGSIPKLNPICAVPLKPEINTKPLFGKICEIRENNKVVVPLNFIWWLQKFQLVKNNV